MANDKYETMREYMARMDAERIERQSGIEFNDARVSPAFATKPQTFSEFNDCGLIVTPGGKILGTKWMGGAQ